MKEFLKHFLYILLFYLGAAVFLSVIYLLFGDTGVNVLIGILVGISIFGLVNYTFSSNKDE